MLSEEVAEKIGKDIVDNDEQGGYDKVDEAIVDVEADKPGSSGAEQSGHQYPSE